LLESLKMNRPSQAESSRESAADAGGASAAAPVKESQTLAEKITAMEKRAAELTTQIDSMQASTSQLPLVLKALAARLGMDAQAPPGSGPPTPKLGGEEVDSNSTQADRGEVG